MAEGAPGGEHVRRENLVLVMYKRTATQQNHTHRLSDSIIKTTTTVYIEFFLEFRPHFHCLLDSEADLARGAEY